MAGKIKILVCGDVNGDFKTLFKRVETVNKKNGPFEFLLCVGKFFGSSEHSWEPYKNGTKKVPILTYILGPCDKTDVQYFPEINGCEICPNLSFIGKRGLFTGSSGVKLAYLSGVENAKDLPEICKFNDNDVSSVRDICVRGHNFRGIDILATRCWPKDVTRFDKQNVELPDSSFLISWLAAHTKPRYHFCASDNVFYERRPYKNVQLSIENSSEHPTRFIALAKVGNDAKEKWLYALNIDPIDQMKSSNLYQQTTDQTECPYHGAMLQPTLRPVKDDGPTQFFYDMNVRETADDNNKRKRHKHEEGDRGRKQKPVFDQGTCWFCLASPEVEKHLVISIGNHAYLALAKGGLVPEHLLILPVGHHQSLSTVPDEVYQEIKQFKSALKKYFKTQNKLPVFFERNYKTSHLQIQVVPVPANCSENLMEIFQEYAEGEGFQLDALPEHAKLEQIAPPGTPYFYAELPSDVKLFHRVRKNFPLQFGREVLASSPVLDMPDRADWRDCKMSKDEESELAKQFRTAFEPYDFTLE